MVNLTKPPPQAQTHLIVSIRPTPKKPTEASDERLSTVGIKVGKAVPIALDEKRLCKTVKDSGKNRDTIALKQRNGRTFPLEMRAEI